MIMGRFGQLLPTLTHEPARAEGPLPGIALYGGRGTRTLGEIRDPGRETATRPEEPSRCGYHPVRPAPAWGRVWLGWLLGADVEGLGAAERDVGVEGEVLAGREAQAGVTAG
jgi:hypothetical protein